jgi:hypothetical protein
MPFSIRFFRRFPLHRAIMYNACPFFTLPLTYVLSFGILLTLLVSSAPAYAEWMSLGESDAGTTVYADSATIRREGDRAKMSVLFDFKIIQAKADVSYLSAKAQMEYDCAQQRFEGLTVLYFSDNMGNGKLLDRSSGKNRWLRISPGSLDHALWKLACGKK